MSWYDDIMDTIDYAAGIGGESDGGGFWNDAWGWLTNKDNADVLGLGLGSLAAISGLTDSNNKATGYQGSIPRYEFNREAVPYDYQNEQRGPGSLGRRYFSDVTYSLPDGMDAETAGVPSGVSMPDFQTAQGFTNEQAQWFADNYYNKNPIGEEEINFTNSPMPGIDKGSFQTGSVKSAADVNKARDDELMALMNEIVGSADVSGSGGAAGGETPPNFGSEMGQGYPSWGEVPDRFDPVHLEVLSDWNAFDPVGGYDPYYLARIPYAAAEVATRGFSDYHARSAQDPAFMEAVINFLESNPMTPQEALRYLGHSESEIEGYDPYTSPMWQGINSSWTPEQASRLAALYGDDNFGVYQAAPNIGELSRAADFSGIGFGKHGLSEGFDDNKTRLLAKRLLGTIDDPFSGSRGEGSYWGLGYIDRNYTGPERDAILNSIAGYMNDYADAAGLEGSLFDRANYWYDIQNQDNRKVGDFTALLNALREQDKVDGYAQGGLAGLPAPKNKGYYLGGITDGMADEVPANIDGEQEAALSDGEFVIPADVVSHLGNGNSNAGARELYDMMDRIRQARTGTPEQGKQIDPQRIMPV